MNIPKANRLRIPPHPAADKTVPRMLVRQTPVVVTAIETSGWPKKPNLAENIERLTFHVKLSDGTVFERDCEVHYNDGERTRFVEAILSGNADELTVKAAKDYRLARVRSTAQFYADMGRTYKQLPTTTRVSA